MSTDTEQRLGELLQQAAIEPPREITVESVRRRAGRQRKSFAGISASTVAVIVAAIVVPITVFGHSHHSGTAVEAGLPGLVLGSLASGRLVLENPTDPKSARVVANRIGSPDSRIIADNAFDGWVTNIGPPPTQIGPFSMQVATVSRDGKVTTFGPGFLRGPITGLAISPNGGELAVATYRPHGTNQQAVIRILPMPGHTGPRRTWTLDPQQVNQVQSLSWAPDNRHLTYIAGTNTGDGISSPPVTLDTATAGQSAPTVSSWPAGSRASRCLIDAVGWIGTAGSLGVVENCMGGRREQFVRVNPTTGAATSTPIPVPGSNCLGATLHSSSAGAVLIGWCGKVFYLHDSSLKLLPGGLTDAAFPGQAPTS